MDTTKLVELLQSGQKLARFTSLVYRSKTSGEKSRFTVITGFNYEKCVEDSLLQLELLSLEDIVTLLISKHGGSEAEWFPIVAQAASELTESLTKTLLGAQDNSRSNQYRQVAPGIKENLNDKTLELTGLIHSKVVLEEGEFKDKKSSNKTIAKDTIRKFLKVGKFRSFALDSGAISRVKLMGETIELE